MTENVGDSGLRFEIWFRRRKSQDTFILQASSPEVKAVWTAIIGKILWRQALRNRGVFLCQIFLVLHKLFLLPFHKNIDLNFKETSISFVVH